MAYYQVAYLVWSILHTRHDYLANKSPQGYLVDFLLNVGALLLAITLYSSLPGTFDIVLLGTAAVTYAISSTSKSHRSKKGRRDLRPGSAGNTVEPSEEVLPVRAFITAYRGSMMVVTCLAILAVDFPVFPRRFAKVETWGTSLMDMGVGSFVFSAGLVSARPLIKATKSSSAFLKSAMKAMLPLLVLGVVRLSSVKAVDYAEHVTEYGLHWNFFFTLAFLAPLAALMQFRPTWVAPSLVPALVILPYEALLHHRRFLTYILTAPRTDLISQNREGIFSFWGYLAIFLAGQALGLEILPGSSAQTSLVRRLSIWLIVWVLQYISTTSYRVGLNWQVSRRLANAPYVEWVVAFNVGQILCFYLIESVSFQAQKPITSQIFRAFNRNGLAIFLLANLLTGAINLSLDTLHMSVLSSMAVLFGYAACLTVVALVLDAYDLSLKL